MFAFWNEFWSLFSINTNSLVNVSLTANVKSKKFLAESMKEVDLVKLDADLIALGLKHA